MPVRKKATTSRDASDDELEFGDTVMQTADKENNARARAKQTAAKKRVAPAKAEVTTIPETQDVMQARSGSAPVDKAGRLELKLQHLQRMNKTLEDKFEELYNRRLTEPEQALEAFTEIANKRAALATEAQAALVHENTSLKEENNLLRKGIAPEAHADREELEKARSELVQLRAALEAAKSQAKSAIADADKVHESERRKWDAKRDKLQDEVDRTRKALEDVQRKTIKPLQDEVNVLKSELRAEVEHSKSLLAKAKTSSSTGTHGDVAVPVSAGTDPKLAVEYEDLKARAELMEDLTGFTVHSKRQHGDDQVTYTCTFGDYLGEHSLAFKLTFGSEGDMRYEPDLEASRDKFLIARLQAKYRSSFRIEAEFCSIFFRNLYASLNAVKLFEHDGADFPTL